MSTVQIVCISGIITAFVVFAAVLAWGEYQTRHLAGRVRDERTHGAGFKVLERAAAEAAGETSPQAGPTVQAM